MKKVILVTGATDGIGLVTAKSLAADGHTVLLHGRNGSKLDIAKAQLLYINPGADIETYQADLSVLGEVKALGQQILEKHRQLDVLINNAGVYVVPANCVARWPGCALCSEHYFTLFINPVIVAGFRQSGQGG